MCTEKCEMWLSNDDDDDDDNERIMDGPQQRS